MTSIRKAFVLGAGLGTRLRPLTDTVPKPMIPLWNRPLLTYAFDHLRAGAGVESFLVNTHHCPGVYEEAFPEGRYEGLPLAFRHEPVLLDTAGGLANILDWLPGGGESFAVYNGDILTDLPLDRAVGAHLRSDALVTLVLRSRGDLPNVTWDPASGRVVDLRGALGRGADLPRVQFTGIYLVRPAFLDYLTPGRIESVVLPFLEAIRAADGVAGVLVDEGRWSDLGNRDSYLEASGRLAREGGFPAYGRHPDQVRLHPAARIDPTARIDAETTVGPGCEVGAGATLRRSILWPGARVEAGSDLTRCVVRGGRVAAGEAVDRDF